MASTFKSYFHSVNWAL